MQTCFHRVKRLIWQLCSLTADVGVLNIVSEIALSTGDEGSAALYKGTLTPRFAMFGDVTGKLIFLIYIYINIFAFFLISAIAPAHTASKIDG